MAQFTTIFIPRDSSFVPDDRVAEECVSLLNDIYRCFHHIESRKHAAPRFIDSGADFDRFACPACHAVVKQYDHQDWWCSGPLPSIRDENQAIQVPCCGAELPLKAFDFGKHVGFARFQINVEGAGEDEGPSHQQLQQLEALMGCGIRRIIHVMD